MFAGALWDEALLLNTHKPSDFSTLGSSNETMGILVAVSNLFSMFTDAF